MSTKRKRRPRVGSSEGDSSIKTPAGMLFHPYAEVFTITIPILETEVNLGVCISCKQAKTRCWFSPGAKVCTRCQTKNLLCVLEPPKPQIRGTRNNNTNTLPSKSRGQTSSKPATSTPGSSTQRKRSNSNTSSQTNCPVKHPRIASSSRNSHSHILTSIVEEDESLVHSFVQDFEAAGPPEHNHTQLTEKGRKARFIDALAGSDNDEGGGGSETGEDFDEEVDIYISSGDSSEEGHKPVNLKTQSRSTKPRRTKDEPNMYDPSKCCE